MSASHSAARLPAVYRSLVKAELIATAGYRANLLVVANMCYHRGNLEIGDAGREINFLIVFGFQFLISSLDFN